MSRKLTPKQARFVAEYVIDMNSAAAARRAGYSPRNSNVTGPKLVANAGIASAIAELQAEVSRRLEVDLDRVVRGLVAIAEDDEAPQSARVQAWGLLGRHLGMFQDRAQAVAVATAVVVTRNTRDITGGASPEDPPFPPPGARQRLGPPGPRPAASVPRSWPPHRAV